MPASERMLVIICTLVISAVILPSATAITASILDSNIKSPFFEPSTQTAEVSEDAAPNTVFYTLQARDPEINGTHALHFVATEPITATDTYGKQVSGTDIFKSFFMVDQTTGEVSVACKLQRDVAVTVRLTMLVLDTTASYTQQGQGILLINITEVNDYAPVFSNPWTEENPYYTLELIEEQPIGTILHTFVANDTDSNIASYALEPDSEYFEINSTTGTVSTKKRIDYEAIKNLKFRVVVYDTGVSQKSSTANVTVNIMNINDMSPVFSQAQYKATVRENAQSGTHVVTVHATDSDEGALGTVTYSMVGKHSADFCVDSNTGEVTVNRSTVLDYESLSELTVQVMASDGAPPELHHSVAVPVQIKLLDENDNPPVFDQHSYSTQVNENMSLSPPMPIVKVHAEDKDEGANGDVRYTILSGNINGVFLMDAKTGILTLAASLRNQPRKFSLIVEGRDGKGRGPHADTATVNVKILGINKNQPVFIMPTFANATIEVPENAGVANYLVMTVKAIDKDYGENGHITYHLKVGKENVQETDEFSIDANTGELRTKIILDKENKTNYSLILVARDHGSPAAYEMLRFLTVLLVDTNNNKPEFPLDDATNPYQFHILENSPSDLLIGKVEALGHNGNNNTKVFYYIVAGNEDGFFYLNKTDGSIFSNVSFDREQREQFYLYIKATNEPNYFFSQEKRDKLDQPERDLTVAHVEIVILDENDNAPRFEFSDYYAGVNAMANMNEFVVKLQAEDPDEGSNGSLIYYIATSNLFKFGSNHSFDFIIPSPFNVTEEGNLVTAKYMAEYNQERFMLDVVVRERVPPEREARVRVHVWIFEPYQLIRVILSRTPKEVNEEREELIAELSNITRSRVVIDNIRYHVDASGHIQHDWCDIYLHVVDGPTQTIAAIPDVLKLIDAKYDYLKDYYAGLAIENVMPAFMGVQEEVFDPALAALIALVIVLFVSSITFIIVCCCLRQWVITAPSDLRKKEVLIKKEILDDMYTLETPMWIEQRLKLYEEQELMMQMFNEPDANELAIVPQPTLVYRNNTNFPQTDNTYITFQCSTQRDSKGSKNYPSEFESSKPNITSNRIHRSLKNLSQNIDDVAVGLQRSTFHESYQSLEEDSMNMDTFHPRPTLTSNNQSLWLCSFNDEAKA